MGDVVDLNEARKRRMRQQPRVTIYRSPGRGFGTIEWQASKPKISWIRVAALSGALIYCAAAWVGIAKVPEWVADNFFSQRPDTQPTAPPIALPLPR